MDQNSPAAVRTPLRWLLSRTFARTAASPPPTARRRGAAGFAVLLAVLLTTTTGHTVAAPPVEAFARFNKISDPKLAPDGKHMAVSYDRGEGNHSLAVFSLPDMALTAMLALPRYELPVQIVWVDDQRIVIAKGRKIGGLEEPQPTGEIIASDFDGKNQRYIYGYDQPSPLRGLDRGFGSIEGVPDQRNGHFYLRSYSRGTRRSTLYDVDARKVNARTVADIDRKYFDFVIDPQGEARYAYGRDDDNHYLLFSREASGWRPIDGDQQQGKLVPLGFTGDTGKIIATYSNDGGPSSLVLANPDGSGRRTLAADGFGSVDRLLWSATHPSQPFAAAFEGGTTGYTYFDESSADARLHKGISSLFPGQRVRYIDHSDDGNTTLIYVHGDHHPGAWYLFYRDRKHLAKLLDSRPDIDPAAMGERRPFRFTASDGLELAGFMTLPAGVTEPAALPTVLLPHGGPHGISDEWSFDADAQFLASRGYLVLQVNYRGSGGRGTAFEESGYRKWGTRVQDDLIEGVRWAIRQGYADPHRIAVYGASFGGYSALMTATRAPDLFRCAIGYAGVYDLKMMYTKGDINDSRWGVNYLRRAIGTDDAELAANSPASLAGKIGIPVLLIHGERDERAPLAQARVMRSALEKAGNPPEWISVADEGHGFYKEENNIMLYERVEAFLARNLQ